MIPSCTAICSNPSTAGPDFAILDPNGVTSSSTFAPANCVYIKSSKTKVVVATTFGKKLVGRSKRDSTASSSSEVAVNAKNRTKSELYFLPRDQQDQQNKGGRTSNSKAAALLVGSTLPQEADLILRLPAGTWAIKDLVGNDTAFVVKYDLRSVELTGGTGKLQGDQDEELTLESNASVTKDRKAKIRSLKLGKMGNK